jgi:hypothetical protein
VSMALAASFLPRAIFRSLSSSSETCIGREEGPIALCSIEPDKHITTPRSAVHNKEGETITTVETACCSD